MVGVECSREIIFKTLNDDSIDEEWFYVVVNDMNRTRASCTSIILMMKMDC